jgi:hypothetical protein
MLAFEWVVLHLTKLFCPLTVLISLQYSILGYMAIMYVW